MVTVDGLKKKGELRIFGHTNGVDSVREALTAAVEIGVAISYFICI
jgi:undecaprenyl pyrophosphate synthase